MNEVSGAGVTRNRVHPYGKPLGAFLAFLVLGVLLAPSVQAQPFGTWLVSNPGAPTTHGYVRIPHSAALNPTGAFTFEAWVNVTNSSTGEDCRSIAGKNYLQAWWVGICTVSGNPVLRSYLKGGSSLRNGGIVPRGTWNHIAVVFTGTQRRHYVNGELAATFPETAPLTTSTSEMRIGSDVSWQFSPTGGLDEVRLWSVARTQAQIRSSINVQITTPQPGLIALWPLDGNGEDIIDGHDGTGTGTGLFIGTFAAFANCSGLSGPFALCLQNRFLVTAEFRTSPTVSTIDGDARVAVNSPNSGIFWFFSADNWEVMVKAINGCGLNNRYWVFSAATTNVFYRMEVFDVQRGAQKIFFNYPGPPAPAVTDVSAFATCP